MRRSIYVFHHRAEMEERALDEREVTHVSVPVDLRASRVRSNWNWIHVNPTFVGVGVHARLEYEVVSYVKTVVEMST